MSAETPITLNMDTQDLQIQTFTVEKLLEPLIIQVTTLVNCPQNPSNRKKGRSKRARVLLASVEEATWNLLDKGEKIAKEAAVLKEELTAALQEVRKESTALKVSAERFTDDPCYLPKREAVVQAARALLAAVTRLLILADMIDVVCLLQHVSSFQRTFESLKNVSNKSDLQKTYQKLGKELENLDYLAFKRQQRCKQVGKTYGVMIGAEIARAHLCAHLATYSVQCAPAFQMVSAVETDTVQGLAVFRRKRLQFLNGH
nr:catenin alpha-3-like [Meriones unguiculatus]